MDRESPGAVGSGEASVPLELHEREGPMDHSMCAGRLTMTPEIAVRFDYDSGFQELKVPQFHPIPTVFLHD